MGLSFLSLALASFREGLLGSIYAISIHVLREYLSSLSGFWEPNAYEKRKKSSTIRL